MVLPVIQIVLLLALLVGIKKRTDRTKTEVFSIEQTNCVKGYCAVLVMLGHFAKDMNGTAMFALNKAGVLGVGVFFFLSGYGLMEGTQKKKDYFCGYGKRRSKTVLMPLLICWLVTGIIKCLFGIYQLTSLFDLKKILREINWFIYAVLVLYVLFYLIFKNLEPIRGSKVLLVTLLIINIILYFSPLDRIYYGGNFCFAIGVLLSLYYEKIAKKMNAHICLYTILTLGVLTLGVFLFLCGGRNSFLGDWIGRNVATIAVVVLLTLFLQRFKWINPILKFLGTIYYELYLVHLSVLSVLNELHIKILDKSVAVYVISLSISLAGAFFLNSLIRLFDRYKKN